RKWKIALIGVGNLGRALLKYEKFKIQGFEIIAIFDNDPKKIGTIKENIKIQDISRLKHVVEKEKIKMAIITVSPDSTQKVVDMVVDSNIKSILNFTPVKINVPPSINLLNIDMCVELRNLSYLTIDKE
ncbi:unnamed protein product, partial [marine sediment metagenome]